MRRTKHIKLHIIYLLLCFLQHSHQQSPRYLLTNESCDNKLANLCPKLRDAVTCNITLSCYHCLEFNNFVPTDIKSLECVQHKNESGQNSSSLKKTAFRFNDTCNLRHVDLFMYGKFWKLYPALNSFVKVGTLKMDPNDICPMLGLCCPRIFDLKDNEKEEHLWGGSLFPHGPFVKISDWKLKSRSVQIVEKLTKIMFISLLMTLEFAKISFVFSGL